MRCDPGRKGEQVAQPHRARAPGRGPLVENVGRARVQVQGIVALLHHGVHDASGDELGLARDEHGHVERVLRATVYVCGGGTRRRHEQKRPRPGVVALVQRAARRRPRLLREERVVDAHRRRGQGPDCDIGTATRAFFV